MSFTERQREVLTPEQAADYLQVDRDTVYRYIRDGRLMASKLGRYYRIPVNSLEALLWATRTRTDVQLREYSPADIARFMEADRMNDEERQIARRFMEANAAT